MRSFIFLSVISMSSTLVSAGLLDDLRQIRGSVTEVSRSVNEVKNISKEISPDEKTKPHGTYQAGDVLTGKISSVHIFSEPSKSSRKIATLARNEEAIFTGSEVNGFYSVSTASNVEGWVGKLLIKWR